MIDHYSKMLDLANVLADVRSALERLHILKPKRHRVRTAILIGASAGTVLLLLLRLARTSGTRATVTEVAPQANPEREATDVSVEPDPAAARHLGEPSGRRTSTATVA